VFFPCFFCHSGNPFCFWDELPALLLGCAEIYEADVYDDSSLRLNRGEMPDQYAADAATWSSSREVYFYETIYGTIRFAIYTHDVDGFPGQVSFRLAELVDELIGVRRLLYVSLVERYSGNIAIAHGIQPVFYCISTAIAAANMEVEGVIADAKGQRSRCQVGGYGGTCQQDENEHQGDQLMGPYSPKQIVDTLEDGAEDALGEQGLGSLTHPWLKGSTCDFLLFRCWRRRLLGG
jgi:hypothetical protein